MRVLHRPGPLIGDNTAGLMDAVLDGLAFENHLAHLLDLIPDMDIAGGVEPHRDRVVIAGIEQRRIRGARGIGDELAPLPPARQLHVTVLPADKELCLHLVNVAGPE